LTDAAHKTIRTAPGVIVKNWNEEFAVAYAPSQAKTHMVSAAGAAILEAASFGDTSMQGLLSLYAPDEDSAEHHTVGSAPAAQHLNTTVDGLVRAGLLLVKA
jgi:hypothetical protein